MRVTTSLSFAMVTIRYLPPAACAARLLQDSACKNKYLALPKPTSQNSPSTHPGEEGQEIGPRLLMALARPAHGGALFLIPCFLALPLAFLPLLLPHLLAVLSLLLPDLLALQALL